MSELYNMICTNARPVWSDKLACGSSRVGPDDGCYAEKICIVLVRGTSLILGHNQE